MLETSTLPPRDRLLVEASLSRMVDDVFGALATLPLYCLGELPASDPVAGVAEHYEVWRSCLIVAREILRSSSDAPEGGYRSWSDLLTAVDDIREAYVRIATSFKKDRAASQVAYARLADSYARLPDLVRNFGGELGIDCSFLPSARSVKQVASERTLRWFVDEIRARASDPELPAS